MYYFLARSVAKRRVLTGPSRPKHVMLYAVMMVTPTRYEFTAYTVTFSARGENKQTRKAQTINRGSDK